ncbi:MAG TPA: hypothetical protein VKH41_00695 [Myxococcota bacterium]|nr:hypothetical protein [Myxococcota bacterium]
MLSKFDDYPIHQTSHPLRQPVSSDRHHYDRYWFNGYDRDGEFYFGIGAALYPNLGIMDCGVSIVRGGEQHAFHASRRAPIEPTELAVGPFRIDILEPMKSLRVTVAENDTGFSCDLLWIPRTANFKEGHQVSGGAATGAPRMEATRFNQFGYWLGEIRYDGHTCAVDPRRVYGTKDRSWGVRPVGGGAPGAPPDRVPQIFFLWAPLHWPDRCTHAGIFANEHGEMWHWDGMLVPTYEDPAKIPGIEDPATEPLAGLEEQITYLPGTRRAQRAVITLLERGGARQRIELEPLLCFRMKGIGYSHPTWGHGLWKGDLAVGGESWKIDDVDEKALENQHIQQVVRATCGDRVGVGVLEQICLGPYRKYGFTEFLDVAK